MTYKDKKSFKGLTECPIVIMSVDRGPDKKPRFPKTLYYKAKMLRELDHDIYIVVTHAPG